MAFLAINLSFWAENKIEEWAQKGLISKIKLGENVSMGPKIGYFLPKIVVFILK